MLRILKLPVYSWALIAGILAVLVTGNLFTMPDLGWYESIIQPGFTPPDWIFAPVWTFLYILLIYAAWRLGKFEGERAIRFWFIVYLFGLNLILNGLWSYLFFTEHLLGAATIDAVALSVSALLLTFLAWPIDRRVTLAFSLYSVWLVFASVLSYNIWLLN